MYRTMFLVMAAGVVGCAAGNGDDAVEPRVVLAQSSSALTAGSLTAVNGTYTSCVGRTGSWSARISGANPLDNATLSVVRGDTACQLKVTELVTSAVYTATPAITLASTYAGSASSFAPAAGGAIGFYANMKVDSVTFDTDFQMSIAYSDDPRIMTPSDVAATYATVTSSVVATVVGAPDYTVNLAGASPLTIQMNASKVVTAVGGVAALTDGTYTGAGYVVDTSLGATPTYLEVALAYNVGTPTAISGANPTIPAAKFTLVGQNVTTPVVRTVIVSRTSLGVLAYEIFRISFKAP